VTEGALRAAAARNVIRRVGEEKSKRKTIWLKRRWKIARRKKSAVEEGESNDIT